MTAFVWLYLAVLALLASAETRRNGGLQKGFGQLQRTCSNRN
jgi:hypothetical protein